MSYARLLCDGTWSEAAVGAVAGDFAAVLAGGDWFSVAAFGLPLGILWGTALGFVTGAAVAAGHCLLRRRTMTDADAQGRRRLLLAAFAGVVATSITLWFLQPIDWAPAIALLVGVLTFAAAYSRVRRADRDLRTRPTGS